MDDEEWVSEIVSISQWCYKHKMKIRVKTNYFGSHIEFIVEKKPMRKKATSPQKQAQRIAIDRVVWGR